MAEYTFRSAAEFVSAFPGLVAKHTNAASETAVAEIHRRMNHELEARTPVGGSLGRDRHAGLMRRSWRANRTGNAYRIGLTINIAGHAQIIEGGRRRAQSFVSGKRTKAGRRRDASQVRKGIAASGKMLGSPQAPKGVVTPSWDAVRKQFDQIGRAAIAAGERGA